MVGMSKFFTLFQDVPKAIELIVNMFYKKIDDSDSKFLTGLFTNDEFMQATINAF